MLSGKGLRLSVVDTCTDDSIGLLDILLVIVIRHCCCVTNLTSYPLPGFRRRKIRRRLGFGLVDAVFSAFDGELNDDINVVVSVVDGKLDDDVEVVFGVVDGVSGGVESLGFLFTRVGAFIVVVFFVSLVLIVVVVVVIFTVVGASAEIGFSVVFVTFVNLGAIDAVAVAVVAVVAFALVVVANVVAVVVAIVGFTLVVVTVINIVGGVSIVVVGFVADSVAVVEDDFSGYNVFGFTIVANVVVGDMVVVIVSVVVDFVVGDDGTVTIVGIFFALACIVDSACFVFATVVDIDVNVFVVATFAVVVAVVGVVAVVVVDLSFAAAAAAFLALCCLSRFRIAAKLHFPFDPKLELKQVSCWVGGAERGEMGKEIRWGGRRMGRKQVRVNGERQVQGQKLGRGSGTVLKTTV